METLKIVVACVFAAVAYGTLHDQITARVCLEYFTVLHPPIFHTQSPTLLGIGWGTYATWPVGLGLGILLAGSARLGRHPKLAVRDVTSLLWRLLGIMAVGAALSGTLGYFFGSMPAHSYYHLILMNPTIRAAIPAAVEHRFLADLWAHVASYAVGISGGLICCVYLYRKRMASGNKAALAGSA